MLDLLSILDSFNNRLFILGWLLVNNLRWSAVHWLLVSNIICGWFHCLNVFLLYHLCLLLWHIVCNCFNGVTLVIICRNCLLLCLLNLRNIMGLFCWCDILWLLYLWNILGLYNAWCYCFLWYFTDLSLSFKNLHIWSIHLDSVVVTFNQNCISNFVWTEWWYVTWCSNILICWIPNIAYWNLSTNLNVS